MCSCRAVMLLGSQGHGGLASVTGMLRWRDMGASGRTGWEDEAGELLFL